MISSLLLHITMAPDDQCHCSLNNALIMRKAHHPNVAPPPPNQNHITKMWTWCRSGTTHRIPSAKRGVL